MQVQAANSSEQRDVHTDGMKAKRKTMDVQERGQEREKLCEFVGDLWLDMFEENCRRAGPGDGLDYAKVMSDIRVKQEENDPHGAFEVLNGLGLNLNLNLNTT